jgi:hypothetical protein
LDHPCHHIYPHIFATAGHLGKIFGIHTGKTTVYLHEPNYPFSQQLLSLIGIMLPIILANQQLFMTNIVPKKNPRVFSFWYGRWLSSRSEFYICWRPIPYALDRLAYMIKFVVEEICWRHSCDMISELSIKSPKPEVEGGVSTQ